MQVMKWSVLALAVTAGTAQLAMASAQSDAKGFIEDSDLQLFNRALYHNRDFKDGVGNHAVDIDDTVDSDNDGDATNDVDRYKKGYAEEFGLGTRVLLESGFTQGTVGFGVDAHVLASTKLDTGDGRNDIGQFGINDQGQAEDTQSEFGGAVKARISNTTIKHGNMFVASPVFTTDDSRILPEVATGTYLVSNEIEGLELSAGHFTAMSSQAATGRDSLSTDADLDDDGIDETYTLTSANIVGASYQFSDNFSGAIHASDVEDFVKKKYLNLNYTLPLADDQSLNFDLNYYKLDDDGKKIAGEIDNKIWSLAAAYNLGAHTVTLAHQRSTGDTGYYYGIDGGSTIWLANSVQISDFDRKDERSWQVRYDLDMETYGVPGLSFMTRYITGENIDWGLDENGNKIDNGEENEWNFESKYMIQEGAAKDLSFRLRHSIYRANTSSNDNWISDMNDTRLIIEYPLDII